jgi:hypothetical protein
MLQRGGRLTLAGLKTYLKRIVAEFVERKGKVLVTTEETDFRIIFTLSVAEEDLEKLTEFNFLYRSLNHIMNKVTHANLGKGGSLNNQFGTTP